MAKDVIMPVLGMNQDTAVLLAWLKHEGEQVQQGEPIMEVETDKATMELDAPASGTLAHVTASAGDEVRVGSVIAVILGDGEVAPSASPAVAPATAAEPPAEAPAPAAPSAAGPTATSAAPTAAPGRDGLLEPSAGGRVPASPKARRLAVEHGVALAELRGRGSGPGGAVLAGDVMRAAATAATAIAARPAQAPATAATGTWATFERELDAGPILAAVTWARERVSKDRGSQGGGAPALEVGDLLARFLGAVWDRQPLTDTDAATLGYRRVAEGTVSEASIEDIRHASLASILAARADAGSTAQPTTGAVMTLLDLTRSRADLSGELPAGSDGALVSVLAGRLGEGVVPVEGVPSVRTTLSLRMAFDLQHVDLGAAAAWCDRVLELVEDPAALALLY